MKVKRTIFILLAAVMLASLLVGSVLAEDGLIFRRNISKTPEGETEKAAIYMMDFYVPAQNSTGSVVPINNYFLADEETYLEEREYAKPLVSVYIDGIAWEEFREEGISIIEGGITFGEFDAFVGISLDDGTTWRTENLSRSADLSSFTLDNGKPYPGDVHAVVHQVAEDKIFVAWASKYCESGSPLYAIDPLAEATYLADLENTYSKDALYLYDFFGVAGNQGSVNYTEQGYPEIGEIPYSCVWTARGKLIAGDDPMTPDFAEASHVLWTKPERLTSGVRDANLPAVDCAKGAGCVLTWQEDPEGLRPGQGLGPGEGWSGAIANAKTDIWYSYIDFADFDLVFSTDDPLTAVATPIEEYERTYFGTTLPKPYVPMAIPVRLTDNDMCRYNALQEDPFCWMDFDAIVTVNSTNITTFLEGLTGPQAGADFCTNSISWTNPAGTSIPLCVTEDGRVMQGRVASTRVRMALKPYTPAGATDRDGDGVIDGSAWLSLAYEETKALGDKLVDPLGTPTDDPLDIGKDVWYHSFDMFNHDLVDQGGMLNQPAKCSPWTVGDTFDCTDYEFFPVQVDPLNLGEFWLTEISRRFAMALNNIANITDPSLDGSGLSGMLIYKQGIINQGGPADIMLRRTVVQPFCTDTTGDGVVDNTIDCFDPAVDNPYAYQNMECVKADGTSGWLYTDGLNPNYLQGMCTAPAINISGSTIKECTAGSGNDACAAAFPVADDGSIPTDIEAFPKVLEWRQCDGLAAIDGCDNSVDTTGDLDDQTWENPYDVAKGHRGFLDGDYVMMMYAWAPNWKANTVGNDHYNLYVRRSFDGGLTWTTTPADWCDAYGACGSGLDALEFYYGETVGTVVPYLWTYTAGAFEQARNVSLLTGNKITILDPRYSPTGGLKQYNTIRTDWLTDELNTPYLPAITSDDTLPYADDLLRDSSKYMMIYETGDNTTVDVGEAIPLDLYYSRATVFGDFYEWFDYVNDETDGTFDENGDLVISVDIFPRWPWLENAEEDLSGEASVVLNPGGTFSYQVWNQWREEITEDGEELIFDSDIWFRRLLYLPDDSTLELMPVSEILYVSANAVETSGDDTLTLIGTGRDLDRMNGDPAEVNPMWTDDRGTIYCTITGYDELGSPVYACEKQIVLKAAEMTPGVYKFHFKVQDGEGKWSEEATVDILVAQVLHRVHLPSVLINK